MADNNSTPYSNNLFSNHFLEERLEQLDEWQQADIEDKFEEVQKEWEKKKEYLQKNPNEDNTQDEWIDEVLKIIGHHQKAKEPKETIGNGRNLNPDYLFYEDFETKLDYDDTDEQFQKGYLIGEAKKYGRTLDKSMDNHDNPSFQIFNYVDRLRTPWGLLTNGKKWRLYSYEDCEADTFYEIDIVENILKEKDEEKALQNFKYFYMFFRQEAFLPQGDSFLNRVYEGSESYSKDLEEDLEEDIYTALEETARGFFETNDIEKTEENIEEVHRNSLILLYRVLFVLNAESRGLLPTDEKKYRMKLSLEYLKDQLQDEEDDVFTDDTWVWDRRIEPLFKAIDEGEQYGDFQITAYNGGLFDKEKHPFLAQHKLQGNHVKRILELLAQSKDEETGEKVLVDYRDLNIRHLGSVYEGLLEHELKKANEDLVLENDEWESASDSSKELEELPRKKKVREGEVYLTNESGERKATGSYYTPEYIVEYIVENTVGPKVDEKIEESSQENLLDNVLELDICDPAMGSGHFLTEATSFIARKVLEHGKISDEEVEGENEFVWVKRQVVSHCIYGVDINPLAVELGKLSLWIETMAEGKPLNFLDHHLKVGNSLIGSNLEDIIFHPNIEERPESDLEEFSVMIEDAKRDLEGSYRLIERGDEDSVDKVHEKENKYQQFQEENDTYRSLKELCNIHTYLNFSNDLSPGEYGGVRDDVQQLSKHRDKEWFQSAQEDAENKNYFHWQLEFPNVFFGEKKGFDAVVGNPPYARIQSLKEHFPETAEYYNAKFKSSTQNFDIYANFTEKGWNLLDREGLLGYIEPHKFFQARMGEGLRKLLSENRAIHQITTFGEHQVFQEASVYTCILLLSKKSQEKLKYREVNPQRIKLGEKIEHYEIEADYGPDKWIFNNPKTKSVLEKIDQQNSTLKDITRKIFVGLQTSADNIYLLEKIEEPENGTVKVRDQVSGEKWEIETGMLKPILKGDDVHRYQPSEPRYWVIFPYNISGEGAEFIEPDSVRNNYPKTWEYLKEHESDLRGREDGKMDREDWYAYVYPKNLDEFEKDRVITPYASYGSNFTYSPSGMYHNTKVYSIVLNQDTKISEKYLLSILNTDILWYYISNTGYVLRGGYFTFTTDYIEPFSVPEIQFKMDEKERNNKVENLKTKFRNDRKIDVFQLSDEVKHDFLVYLSERMMSLNEKLNSLNLNIIDYLGSYDEGKALNDLYNPASGVSDTPLTDTASDREKLQVGSVDTQRNGDSVTVLASARYKPEDESGHDTDQYGYTETELFPAMEFHDLSETEKALIEEFVPVAVDESGGFADFRKKATKTMSLIDRLKKLTLPKVSDVEDDLQKFIEQRNKAEELEEKIENTDQEINEIVYDLYDLTEEEIEIVEESVEN